MVNHFLKEIIIIDYSFLEYWVMHRLPHNFTSHILRENTISLKIINFVSTAERLMRMNTHQTADKCSSSKR